MLHFKPLGWQKEDETSPNNIHLKRHHGVDGLFRYLAVQSNYILEEVILCNVVSMAIDL